MSTDTVDYAFDDKCVGVSTNNMRSITHSLIPRPAGLSQPEWWSHATNIVQRLREAKKAGGH